MAQVRRKEILVAVDGSRRSLHTVKYVSTIPGFCDMNVVLFGIYSEAHEAYLDFKRLPQFSERIGEFRDWEIQSKNDLEVKLREAKGILLEAGIPEESIIVRNRKRRQGIARDLLKEGKKYNAIAIARRSSSKIKELMLGSISTKLIETVDFAPLIVVGVKSTSDGILVAVDGSPNSARSLGFLTRMMAGGRSRILLFHAIHTNDKNLVEIGKESIEEIFEQAKTRLSKAGFGGEDVATKVVTGVHSRAAAIVDEARAGNYGTIVVGRRGLSRVKQFFMGRVSKKVVYLSRGLAVWIVH